MSEVNEHQNDFICVSFFCAVPCFLLLPRLHLLRSPNLRHSGLETGRTAGPSRSVLVNAAVCPGLPRPTDSGPGEGTEEPHPLVVSSLDFHREDDLTHGECVYVCRD